MLVVTKRISKRHGPLTSTAGMTLLEILTAMVVFAGLLGISASIFSSYQKRIRAERAAEVAGYWVSLTRTHAVQRRTPVSLVIDPVAKTLEIRAVSGETIDQLNMGPGSDLELDTLDMGFPGDSVTFNARGACRQCGLTGTGGILVGAQDREYLITFNALGIWKKEIH